MNSTENKLYDLVNEIANPLSRLTRATWDRIENPLGATEEEVKKPLVLPLCKKRVGIVSFCEHEFSWYEDYGVGARGFDPLCSLDEISFSYNQSKKSNTIRCWTFL